MSGWYSRRSMLVVVTALILGSAACTVGHTSKSSPPIDSRAGTSSSGSSAAAQSTGSGSAAQPRVAAAAAATASSSAPSTLAGLPDASAGGAASFDRKIVRNAELSVEIARPQDAPQTIAAIVSGLGGYVSASTLSGSDTAMRGSMTVRVPAESFDQAMEQFRHLGVKVDRETISSQDVTQEYADLDARVRNLEATQDQLRLLLATVREKSNNANDVLAVYRQLTDIGGQIEQAKGRQLYLDKLSTLATIVVDISPYVAVQQPSSHATWSPVRTLEDAARVLGRTGQLAVESLIWIAIVVLPLIVVAGVLALIALVVRRTLVRSHQPAP